MTDKKDKASAQVPYESMSHLGEVTKVVPASMEASVKTVNSRFLIRHPEGVDDYVSKKLGMSPDKLEIVFSPEQIDAIGIAIDQIESGNAPLIGDQTGVGKGRVLAALMGWRIKNGHNGIYLTEHASSFSDIYREIHAIGMGDFVQPFIMKAGDKSARIISEDTGKTIIEPLTPLQSKALAVLQHWPDGKNIKAIKISKSVSSAFDSMLDKDGKVNQDDMLSDIEIDWLYDHFRPGYLFFIEDDELITGIMDFLDKHYEGWIESTDLFGKEGFAPKGNLCLTTYSQFNRKGYLTQEELEKRSKSRSKKSQKRHIPDDRAVWLDEMTRDGVAVVMDEVHSASNLNSATGYNINIAVQNAWNSGSGVAFGTATWTKNADGMDIYMPSFPPSIRNAALRDMMEVGGVAMQEILTTMLVSEGRMVRREHPANSAKFIVTFDEENFDRNRDFINSVSPILSDLGILSGQINSRVLGMMGDTSDIAKSVRKKGMKSFNINNLSLRSFSHNLSLIGEALNSSLRIDHTVNLALKALNEGRKPVVFLDNTMDSLLDELKRNSVVEKPSFKHILLRLLDRITYKDDSEKSEKVLTKNIKSETKSRLSESILALIPDGMKHVNQKGILGSDSDENIRLKLQANYDESKRLLHETGCEDYLSFFISIHDKVVEKAHEEYLDDPTSNLNLVLDNVSGDLKQLVSGKRVDGPAWFSNIVNKLEQNVTLEPLTLIKTLRSRIESMPEMAVSVIDEIRHRLTDAGYNVDEITGRHNQLDENGNIIPRDGSTPRNVIKDSFNRGEIDALIINRRGASAIDLHAGSRFTDQRQREMIVHQAPRDVEKFVQGLGRVLRHDQIIEPIINYPITGMPSELAALAAQNKKLSSMSASTSGNRISQAMIDDIPDLLNPVGDQVISDYVNCRPELKERLGYDVHEVSDALVSEEELVDDTHESNALAILRGHDAGNIRRLNDLREREHKVVQKASSILQRVSRMLPFSEQEKVIGEVVREYKSRIAELDAQNRNPLKQKHIEGIVRFESTTLLEGVPVDENSVLWKRGYISEFDRPVYVNKVKIKTYEATLQSKNVDKLLSDGIAEMTQSNHDMAEYIRDNCDSLLRSHMPRGVSSVQQSVEENIRPVIEASKKLAEIADMIEKMVPGSSIKVTVDGDVMDAVVLKVRAPANSAFKGSAAHYHVRVAIVGDTRPRSFSLSVLIAQGVVPDVGMNGKRKKEIGDLFDKEAFKAIANSRKLLTGNDYRLMALAVENNLGTLVTYYDDEKVLRRGLLVPKSDRQLDLMRIPLLNANIAMKVLVSNKTPGSKVDLEIGKAAFGNSNKAVIQYLNKNGGSFSVKIPLPNNPRIRELYRNEGFKKFMARYQDDFDAALNASKRKSSLTLDGLPQSDVGLLLKIYQDAGISVTGSPAYRSVIQKYEKEYYHERFGDAVSRSDGNVVDKREETKTDGVDFGSVEIVG